MLFIDAAKTDVVFVQNASTGNNAVIQSVLRTLKPGDSILTTSVAYGERASPAQWFMCSSHNIKSSRMSFEWCRNQMYCIKSRVVDAL